ncbi:twin-arginine translocase subunit TatB [Sphingobium subterraneum]|uniref:Sec-independent protein translocase protein TatB n=1 Tax=Sphingobium subterraneum TaxID=627688 RepID=A0A841J4Y6_9SPHN|nr:twin-arginine translocase subunit TatB [Sphingobium subterraneum]MBB6123598.1 sec-independent protein translocase protein TatB [Sphingobium subterraneum]
MFGLDSGEFLVIAIVAIVVIGPKDLPRVLYKVGQVMGKARAMSRHFRSGIDAMVREVELEELEKKWAADNRRIMGEHPMESLDAPAPASSAAVEEADSAMTAMADGTASASSAAAIAPKGDPA